MKKFAALVSANLLAKAVDLSPFGSNNYGWTRLDAISVINRLEARSVVISGGDVWRADGGRVVPALENWYCNFDPQKPSLDDVHRCADKARKFVDQFDDPIDWAPLFEIVCHRQVAAS